MQLGSQNFLTKPEFFTEQRVTDAFHALYLAIVQASIRAEVRDFAIHQFYSG